MSWRVTQYDADTHLAVYSKVYRLKVVAILVAWAVAGRGTGGVSYFSQVQEKK